MKVILVFDDIDRHGGDPRCNCGLCNSNGKSYGISVYDCSDIDLTEDDLPLEASLVNREPLDRVYSCSEESAFHNARLLCEQNGWEEVKSFIIV